MVPADPDAETKEDAHKHGRRHSNCFRAPIEFTEFTRRYVESALRSFVVVGSRNGEAK